jgi:hypothetical protein
MQRDYVMRGRRVSIEELDGIVAVMPRVRGKATAEVAPEFGQMAETPTDLGEAEWQGFLTAGWVFVRPSAEVSRAVAARAPIQGAEAAQRVFRHPSGRIFLGTDRLSVRLRADLTESQALSILGAEGLEVVNRLKFATNLFEVRVPPGRDFLQASVELSGRAEFEYAEPQFIEHIPGRFTPTDPDYGQQWHLNNTGQSGGTAGADISAERAWDITRGAGVRLAVIDNGFDVNHPDLAAAVAATSSFFRMDAIGNTAFTQGLVNYPVAAHGTFCAGMAIARANNAEGGCGVANQADFIAVACLGDQVGTQATLARAIAYAVDPAQEVAGANPADGADVISCSLGPNGANWDMTQTLQDAIDFAVASGRGGLGTPIFWAVTNGNFQIQLDEVCSYVNTIHVARSTRNDLEDNAGFGPELDFLATGVNVYNTDAGGGYRNWTGCSFAAPVAAGVGALVLAVRPDLTWQQVRQIMRDTCDQIGGVVYDATGHNDDYGWGRVNAERAVFRLLVAANRTSLASWTDAPYQHVAYVGEFTHVHELYYEIGTGPWKHSDLSDLAGAPPAAPAGLTSWVDPNGAYQHVAYVAPNGRVHELFYEIGVGPWKHSNQISTAPAAPDAAADTALTSWTDGAYQHVAYVGVTADSHVHELFYEIGVGPWKHADLQNVTVPTPPRANSHALTSWVDRNGAYQHVAYLSPDKHVHELFYEIGVGPWKHADLVAAAAGSPSALSDRALTSWTEGAYQHVSYVGDDSHVHELFFEIGVGPWKHADLVAAAAGAPNAAANSALTSWTVGAYQHVAYLSADSHVHELFYEIGVGPWKHADLVALAGAPNAAADSALTSWADPNGAYQHVAYVGDDRHVHELFFEIGVGPWKHADLTALAAP